MSFPSYADYKNSNVEWIGEVPRHWDIKPIKRLSPVLRGASPRPIEDPKYFDEDGEYCWVRIADVSASSGVLKETPQRLSGLGSSLSVKLEPGALIVSIAGSVGKPCMLGVRACIHDGFVYFPNLNIPAAFLYRIFEAGFCYGGLGKMGTQLNLNTDTIGSIQVAVPATAELNQILLFLDRETPKIDALVEEQQRLIALLKDKRQAVISHAVTKGLDPNAPMKDSGVEWLGEVPAHWGLKQLKRAVVFQRGHDLPTDDREDGSIPVVSSGGVSGYHSEAITSGPTIVTGRYGSIGEFHFVEAPCWPLNTALYSVETYDNFPRYLWYMVQACRDHFIVNSMKSAVPGVDRNDIHPIRIAVPPGEEQKRIVRLLDAELSKLDQLTEEASIAITLLQERRAALISAAVTGKIDVRALVPDTAEAA